MYRRLVIQLLLGPHRRPLSNLPSTTTTVFQEPESKTKSTFLEAVHLFHGRDKHARGHVEFIYSALKHMKEFGVHRDLEAYKRIIDVFPKGRFIPTNMWQVEFIHFPKQQQCALDLLEQMEDAGVQPDSEMEQQLINIFGSTGFPVRKLMRMAYWMPKFKNLSPWPLPDPMPDGARELAELAIKRMNSVDRQAGVEVWEASSLPDSLDPTWIVNGQSPTQRDLIQSHPTGEPVYVEGAFRIWMQRTCINYFILRSKPQVVEVVQRDLDDVGSLSSPLLTPVRPVLPPTVHEQDDGIILATCATGTSSRDSLLSWIRLLEKRNPRLGTDISVLFTLKSPLGPTVDLELDPGLEQYGIEEGETETRFVNGPKVGPREISQEK